MNHRRCKIFSLPVESVLTLMGEWRQYDFVRLPILKGLPDGYRVRNVQFNFGTQAFDFLIEHESFPETPDGNEYPRGNSWAEAETIEIPDSMKRRDDPAAINSITIPAGSTLDLTKDASVNIGEVKMMISPTKPTKKHWEFLGAP
jgi:hypothetical protein